MVTLNLSKARQQLILGYTILHPDVQRTLVAAQGAEITIKELDLEHISKHFKVEAGDTTYNSVRRDVEKLIVVLGKAWE